MLNRTSSSKFSEMFERRQLEEEDHKRNAQTQSISISAQDGSSSLINLPSPSTSTTRRLSNFWNSLTSFSSTSTSTSTSPSSSSSRRPSQSSSISTESSLATFPISTWSRSSFSSCSPSNPSPYTSPSSSAATFPFSYSPDHRLTSLRRTSFGIEGPSPPPCSSSMPFLRPHGDSNPSPSSFSRRFLTKSPSHPNLHTPSPQSSYNFSSDVHSYNNMAPASVIATQEEEETCPVCVEPMDLRLAGEKPITPVCGHRLHEVCFESVYGSVARAKLRGTTVGLCGVCRRDMKLGDDASGTSSKRNKLAALHGDLLPSGMDSHKMRSISHRTLERDDDSDAGLQEDDEIVQLPPPTFVRTIRQSSSTGSTGSTLTAGRRGSADTMKASSSSSRSSQPGDSGGVVKPLIIVRAEHAAMQRSFDKTQKQSLTCMVTIEMPPRWPVPSAFRPESIAEGSERPSSYDLRQSTVPSLPLSESQLSAHPARPSSPTPSSVYSAYAYGSTGSVPPHQQEFDSVVKDLRARMVDWKGHHPDEFGALRLYDYLDVQKDRSTREFLVYLFEEAILCVSDDKRKGIGGKIVDGLAGPSMDLRLKGRVYARHIRTIVDSSHEGGLSLTIRMSDDALDEFIMVFKDRPTLELWKAQIEVVVSQYLTPSALLPPPPPPAASMGLGMNRNGRGITNSTSHDSFRSGSDYGGSGASDSSRSAAHSSSFSNYTRTTTSSVPVSSVIHEEQASDFQRDYNDSPPDQTYPSLYRQPSGNLSISNREVMRSYTPLDLMLILSVPSTGATELKLNILKSTLDFLINNVGPRTRISLVTFSTGEGIRGSLHKTPFIAVGTQEGRSRLDNIVRALGSPDSDSAGLVEHKEERVHVVTAINLALDILLQRKSKSALTGVVLMNDGKDGTQKQAMDLVNVRAEAANVIFHCIGWGRSHDPTTLWLISDHTQGTYTYCKEFYDLKDTMAGCVGGMLSIAATNVHLHISVPERRWFRIRKITGANRSSVVSSDGKHADIRLNDLRFGERRDVLVEVEMAAYDGGASSYQEQRKEETQTFSTATDAFLSKVGLDPATLADYQSSSFYDDEYDGMPDEVPLFEVNAAYRDPAAGKTVSRLRQSPCLLTITLTLPNSMGNRASVLPAASGAPEIIRRRIELLCADMIARALLLLSRGNDSQAARLLAETKRIIGTISATLAPPPAQPSRGRSSFISSQSIAYTTLRACAEDVNKLIEGCATRELFETSFRFMAAQHAVVLREQRAFCSRSAIEQLFWTSDNSRRFVELSQHWVSTRSD